MENILDSRYLVLKFKTKNHPKNWVNSHDRFQVQKDHYLDTNIFRSSALQWASYNPKEKKKRLHEAQEITILWASPTPHAICGFTMMGKDKFVSDSWSLRLGSWKLSIWTVKHHMWAFWTLVGEARKFVNIWD